MSPSGSAPQLACRDSSLLREDQRSISISTFSPAGSDAGAVAKPSLKSASSSRRFPAFEENASLSPCSRRPVRNEFLDFRRNVACLPCRRQCIASSRDSLSVSPFSTYSRVRIVEVRILDHCDPALAVLPRGNRRWETMYRNALKAGCVPRADRSWETRRQCASTVFAASMVCSVERTIGVRFRGLQSDLHVSAVPHLSDEDHFGRPAQRRGATASAKVGVSLWSLRW
jgi:hypothetical protein